MNFAISTEQQHLVAAIRRFVDKSVSPFARFWEKARQVPENIIQEVASLGLLGVTIDERYGGAGFGLPELILATENLAAGDGSLALLVASHNGLCAEHIATYGSDRQKTRYLPSLASGEKLGAWALSGPENGSDAQAMTTGAEHSGSGWLLNGTKNYVIGGTRADIFVTFAKTSDKGITAFLVERNTVGLQTITVGETLGMRSSGTARLVFDSVFLADENRLGNRDEGFRAALKILARERMVIAALAVGLGCGAQDASSRYVKTRKQFGQTIGEFQAIQWKLADMACELDAAALLIGRAVFDYTCGKPFAKQAAMAKLFAAEVAHRACYEAIQVHGGIGYTKELALERHYRDVKFCSIGGGTLEIQKILIANYELLNSNQ